MTGLGVMLRCVAVCQPGQQQGEAALTVEGGNVLRGRGRRWALDAVYAGVRRQHIL